MDQKLKSSPIVPHKLTAGTRGCAKGHKKVSSTLSASLPLNHEGKGVFFLFLNVHNNLMSNILQDIFKDHYEEMLYTLHHRKSVIENVNRMINCGDSSWGGAMHGCGKCGTLKFVPFRCHSCLCPTFPYCQSRKF